MDEERPGLTESDVQQLQLLEIGYYLIAAFSAIGGLAALGFVGLGALVGAVAESATREATAAPILIGMFFGFVAFFVFIVCASIAAASFYTGQFLRRRRHRVFCLVMAGLTAMNAPLGTLLGVFTFVVLARPSVASAFDD